MTDAPFASMNPATGEVEARFETLTEGELERRLDLASIARREARREPIRSRRRSMLLAADLLDAEAPDIAATITREMGKTFAQAKGEAAKCSTALRFFAEHAEEMLESRPAPYDPKSHVSYSPLGTILAVMPWNFPLWQVMRCAAPGLMAGNTILLKHAPNVPQTALNLESLFLRAGFPEGSFQNLFVGTAGVGEIIGDRRVDAVTLTGSATAGSAVAAAAGRYLKKSVMELGGSDPFIVMPSADIDAAVDTAVTARLQNSGQSCIAAKRFIVHRGAYEEFRGAFIEKMASARMGDPFAPDTDLGPLSSNRQRATVVSQVEGALDEGARLILGGELPDGPGFWYPPTVLEAVTPSMRIYSEEVFGPVAPLYRVEDLDEAIALANDSPFGLGASVFTEDEEEMARFAAEIDTGQVAFNLMVASSPERPFGGVKQSGYGVELGEPGIREFCSVKVIRRP